MKKMIYSFTSAIFGVMTFFVSAQSSAQRVVPAVQFKITNPDGIFFNNLNHYAPRFLSVTGSMEKVDSENKVVQVVCRLTTEVPMNRSVRLNYRNGEIETGRLHRNRPLINKIPSMIAFTRPIENPRTYEESRYGQVFTLSCNQEPLSTEDINEAFRGQLEIISMRGTVSI